MYLKTGKIERVVWGEAEGRTWDWVLEDLVEDAGNTPEKVGGVTHSSLCLWSGQDWVGSKPD